MRVARPLTDLSQPAEGLLVDLSCHACGHPALLEVNHHDGTGRRTWTGRCPECRAETVVVVDLVAIHAGGREFAELHPGAMA